MGEAINDSHRNIWATPDSHCTCEKVIMATMINISTINTHFEYFSRGKSFTFPTLSVQCHNVQLHSCASSPLLEVLGHLSWSARLSIRGTKSLSISLHNCARYSVVFLFHFPSEIILIDFTSTSAEFAALDDRKQKSLLPLHTLYLFKNFLFGLTSSALILFLVLTVYVQLSNYWTKFIKS